MRKAPFIAWAFLLGMLPHFGSAQSAFESLISESCLDCHDEATEKGDLSLESLQFPVRAEDAGIWLKCLEQVENEFMPPPKKSKVSREERHDALLDLETRLVAFHVGDPPRPAVLRRLNRVEYRNTIRDLLHLNLDSIDPTSEFPADQRSHGFAADGETLVTSGFLLRQYLEAAEKIVDAAVHFEPQPEVRHWDLKPPFDRTNKYQTYGEAHYFKNRGLEQPYQSISQRMIGLPKGGYRPVDDLKDGVPESGWYQIRIRAEAKFRHSLDQSLFQRFPSLWDETEPIRLSLFTGTLQGIDPQNQEALDYAAIHQQAGERCLATWDLPDDEATWLECRVWLDAGDYPRLGFPNGPTDSNYRLLSYFKDNAEKLLDPEALANFREEKGDWNVYMWFESPRIRLYRIEIEGPLIETWPPPSHREIFGDAAYTSEKAEQVLLQFAAKAWRHPVDAPEIAPLVKLVRAAEEQGLAPEAAIREGLKGVLCSPEFLYREEAKPSLDNYEIASRLSYFLWSSMPDSALLGKAAAGELSRPGVLRTEAARLLADPKSDAFVAEFLDGWLGLRKLGSMAPDVHRFAVYYEDDLESAMRAETRLFFRHLLDTNGPVERFLNCDYTFVNKELGQLYGIKPEEVAAERDKPVPGLDERYLRRDEAGNAPTTKFAMVGLKDPRRGGVLGQASVLTLTANGVDTSPVIRGVWLLKNILGTPPSPPPPDVPTIEPDIRGAKTIRDQLQKHRESATCRSCHSHIDPPGFALESFDPIGKWRGHYRLGEKYVKIDPSGTFGTAEFKDVVEFKTALIERREHFARCLAEKLLISALGRELTIQDRPHLRAILESTEANRYPLRDLVLACVESDLFRQK